MTLAILPALIGLVLILMLAVRWWHRWRWRRQIEAAHSAAWRTLA